MTEQEKQLLLIDLCARLPYGVKVKNVKNNFDINNFDHNVKEIKFLIEEYDIKPYLRPISSMTAEEEEEYNRLLREVEYYPGKYFIIPATSVVDWLNAHYFDYRIVPFTGKTLIESGLALEAPEGMYKTE